MPVTAVFFSVCLLETECVIAVQMQIVAPLLREICALANWTSRPAILRGRHAVDFFLLPSRVLNVSRSRKSGHPAGGGETDGNVQKASGTAAAATGQGAAGERKFHGAGRGHRQPTGVVRKLRVTSSCPSSVPSGAAESLPPTLYILYRLYTGSRYFLHGTPISKSP